MLFHGHCSCVATLIHQLVCVCPWPSNVPPSLKNQTTPFNSAALGCIASPAHSSASSAAELKGVIWLLRLHTCLSPFSLSPRCARPHIRGNFIYNIILKSLDKG